MPDTAIKVEQLAKMYMLGKAANSEGLRHAIHDLATAPLRWLKKGPAGKSEPDDAASSGEFWALKNVSFEVKQGEVVGVIGRNGAGKSTLLKVLSRITEPTRGRVEITGRVASLLEVGTGFHPELSGRENIFLNGGILGMSRAEVKKKFDEIVDFAEVEKFLDMPVKRYSSGMYVRLAFAVAAHLEPEILIVDEVLAVGDAQFQKKCLGKMKDVASHGRTVLFVSHNMDAVLGLCGRGVLLHKGNVAYDGEAQIAVSKYLNTGCDVATPGATLELGEALRSGSGRVKFESLRINPTTGNRFYSATGMTFELALNAQTDVTLTSLAIAFFSENNWKLLNLDTYNQSLTLNLRKGKNLVNLTCDQLPLTPGNYRIMLWMSIPTSGEVIDYVENAAEVVLEPKIQTGETAYPGRGGAIHLDFQIEHK